MYSRICAAYAHGELSQTIIGSDSKSYAIVTVPDHSLRGKNQRPTSAVSIYQGFITRSFHDRERLIGNSALWKWSGEWSRLGDFSIQFMGRMLHFLVLTRVVYPFVSIGGIWFSSFCTERGGSDPHVRHVGVDRSFFGMKTVGP
jgi:hypothetical protein